MDRRFNDWVMRVVPEFPHAGKESFIITRNARPAEDKVQFSIEDSVLLFRELKQRSGKNFFINGGAQLVQTLMQAQVADALKRSVCLSN